MAADVDRDLVKIAGVQVTIPDLPAGTQNPRRIPCSGETELFGVKP